MCQSWWVDIALSWVKEAKKLHTHTQNRLCLSSHSLSFKSLFYARVILDRTLPQSGVFLGLVCHVLTYSISSQQHHNLCLQWRNHLQDGPLFRWAWRKLSKQIAQSALGRVTPKVTEHPSSASRDKIQMSYNSFNLFVIVEVFNLGYEKYWPLFCFGLGWVSNLTCIVLEVWFGFMYFIIPYHESAVLCFYGY